MPGYERKGYILGGSRAGQGEVKCSAKKGLAHGEDYTRALTWEKPEMQVSIPLEKKVHAELW